MLQNTGDMKAIIGLGMTGLSCARHFLRTGEPFRVIDSRQNPPGLAELKELAPEVEITLGVISEEALEGVDTLVLSPGIDPRQPAIRAAVSRGVSLSGDIDIFSREAGAAIVAVTGSNAKSTVVTLLGEMAKASGLEAALGGNIGIPALDLLHQSRHSLYILELSSFQLETVEHLGAEVSSILNISSDHLDRYDDFEAYRDAKQRIYRGTSFAVINRHDPLTHVVSEKGCRTISFGLDTPQEGQFGITDQDGQAMLSCGQDCLMPLAELRIAGSHNVMNALAALAIGECAGLDREGMLTALRNFTGLPHRCQWVADCRGVSFYNDSKGTNPGACIAAIEGLASRGRIRLIAGGQGKGADFAVMKDVLSRHVDSLVLIGEDAAEMQAVLQDSVPVVRATGMHEAVARAYAGASVGDVVLLSPACASFDMFEGYQHRGDCFVEAVRGLSV